MRPFDFVHADDGRGALAAFSQLPDTGPTHYLAGGTTLLDLMKLDVMRPSRVVDINKLADPDFNALIVDSRGLYLGAMLRMADAAGHEDLRRLYPVVAQSLELAASAQIRNMASLGGNVLQRTRCGYFRDTSYRSCNKRIPGSGCAALEGMNRTHAVLGTSDQCIATYPGDFAQALMALNAKVDIIGAQGARQIPFNELHRAPGSTPHIETSLAPDELIRGFLIPLTPFARRSVFLKTRDRESYEFALASAAVALDIDEDRVREARIALGGVAAMPWRSREAEITLVGQRCELTVFRKSADAAFEGARPFEHNAFKIELGKRTLVRALQQAAALEI